MGKLTAKQIENLTTPGTYEDGDGLRLLIKPNGMLPGLWLLFLATLPGALLLRLVVRLGFIVHTVLPSLRLSPA